MLRTLAAVSFALRVLVAADSRAGDEPLHLYVLDCGTMRGVDSEPFLAGVPDRPEHLDMVNRCFLVVHPMGTLLWDVGFPDSWWFTLARGLFWLVSFGQSSIDAGPGLVDQLAELGFASADIDYLALSHVHFDHAGEANAFAGSTWLVQESERAWAFSEDLDNSYVMSSLYADLEQADTLRLHGDHDVFGDGSVMILSSPGHTPGHQSLYLELPETGRIVLSGDLYHTPLNRELRLPPVFNTDAEETRRSMEHIESRVTELGAQLWIQHAPESGRQAPARVR
jgi:glyoxylase-like metal-dependent hydrolase (beta-lactamase superfamily II)